MKWILNQAGIKDASPHTLRKTAGAWYYMATRDIFATAKFLGHSIVRVTEEHYAGLIQSLKVEYAQQYEQALSERLQSVCNFEIKPDQFRPLGPDEKIPSLRRETGDSESGRCRTSLVGPVLKSRLAIEVLGTGFSSS